MFRITDGILLGAAASLSVFLWLNGQAKRRRTVGQRSDSAPRILNSHPVLAKLGHKDDYERYRNFRLN